jgi:hypothetical protein
MTARVSRWCHWTASRALLAGALLLALAETTAAQLAPPAGSGSTTEPALDAGDRARIVEALRVSRLVGDSLWPGWSEPPFAILLVTAEAELLIGHPRPSRDFADVGTDAIGRIFRRKRVFPPDLLASFPAVGGVPTVVVGTSEATGKGATAWVLSLLHERFHQLQMSRPDYFEKVAALGLAHGDTTGQWMVEYPFPYDDPEVRGSFVDLASHLLRALELAGTTDFGERLEAYHAARARFREGLSEDDWKYAQFQMWQEGVARYTELELAELAAQTTPPAPAFRALPGYEPYAAAAERLRREVLEGLQTATLSDDRRVAFYPLGAATALLLDAVRPSWRERYLDGPLALDPHFQSASPFESD